MSASRAALSGRPGGIAARPLERVVARGPAPSVLADIFDDKVNLAVWERRLSESIKRVAAGMADNGDGLLCALTVSPQDATQDVSAALRAAGDCPLVEDIAGLVRQFSQIIGTDRVGLRLTALGATMCPKFHVDFLPCRMVTTYQGPGSEWLPNGVVDRSKLGTGSAGRPDHLSGLYRRATDIQRLIAGEVALLKGDLWPGNEGGGLVHRSPGVPNGQSRLLLTLDLKR